MDNSLQDQLRRAGLVDKQKAQKIRSEKRKTAKQQRSNKTGAVEQNRIQVLQAQKAERDRAHNRQRQEEAKRKEIDAQIRQLIEQNRLPRNDGEVPYHFTDRSILKKIYVTPEMQKELSSGKSALVRLDGRYELVPAAIAEKVRARNEDYLIVNDRQDQADDENGEYADYKVPDDLIW